MKYIYNASTSLKVHYCRFENLPICVCSNKNNIYPENFAFLIQRIIELFAHEICKFLKSRLIFNILYCFCKQTFHTDTHMHISQKIKCV